jgi:hypothetical protein
MTLKSSAFLALVGMILVTVLCVADFVRDASGVLRDLIPAVSLFRSLIYVIASLSVTLFFYVFHRAQSR